MSSTKNDNINTTNDSGDNELLDITELIKQCASEYLSYSHPFTPLTKDGMSTILDGGCSKGDSEGLSVTDGTLLEEKLHIQGINNDKKSTNSEEEGEEDANNNNSKKSPKLVPLDLLDAMTALELGDKRMDCCEIPLLAPPSCSTQEHEVTKTTTTTNTITFPPRIAPTKLSDGTIDNNTTNSSLYSSNYQRNYQRNYQQQQQTSSNNTHLLLPTSPNPSLLPHWDTISTSALLPLLTLQLTALEAYIGTNNGGSDAAETLYCMLWFHDGILCDMAERLGMDTNTNDMVANGVKFLEEEGNDNNNNNNNIDELTVAQWTLFASSLGIVRIAEAVRWVVVNADFYEEEDFGVTLHGEKDNNIEGAIINNEDENNTKIDEGGGNNIVDGQASTTHDGEKTKKREKKEGSSSATRFCPALQGSQHVEIAWDTALLYLRRYKSSCSIDIDQVHPTIDALENILRLQQSFYQAVKILSNLNDETVRDFTKIASNRSKETVALFGKLRDSAVMERLIEHGLVGLDGRLQPFNEEPELNALLSASFDPFVNRRLLGNAPVRKACFRRPLDVMTSLSKVADELDWGVCDVIRHGNTFGRITRMLENNSLRGCGGAVPPKKDESSSSKDGLKIETPVGMNILSRSLVVLNLYFDDKLLGQYDFTEFLGQHMKQQCAAPELLISCSTDWLSRIAKPMYDTLKCLCLCRHRERGFIELVLLPAFKILQYEARNVDEQFHNQYDLDPKVTAAYATNYVILTTVRLMERHVGLGIELGLYPNWYDLSTALWYRDFLLSALINVKSSIEREKVQRKEMIRQQEEEEKKARKKGKTKKGKKSKQRPTSPSTTGLSAVSVKDLITAESFEDRIDYTSILLQRNLCRGLVRCIAALRQAKLLSEPPASITMFTTHQKRFEKRFAAFSTMPQPPSLAYDDYVQGSDFSAVQSKDLLKSATECFRTGKGVVDWLLDVVVSPDNGSTINETEKRRDDDLYVPIRRDEIMALAKVCVTNSLFLHKLGTMNGSEKKNSGDDIKGCLEYKTHKLYCTFSIQ